MHTDPIPYTYYPSGHESAGQVATVTANGKVTRYAYNHLGRKTHQWGVGSQPLKYVFDGLGRVHELHTYQDGANWANADKDVAFNGVSPAITTWDYHAGTNALSSKTDDADKSVTYTYDSAHGGLLRKKQTHATRLSLTTTSGPMRPMTLTISTPPRECRAW